MSSGLSKILEKIIADPSNKVLIKRYIALVREVPKDQEKVAHILAVSKALIDFDPADSMQYAFMVFQYENTSIPALEIIAKCLKSLGRFGKATVIENEIQKLKDNQGGGENHFSFDASSIKVGGKHIVSASEFTGENQLAAKLPQKSNSMITELMPQFQAKYPTEGSANLPLVPDTNADQSRPSSDNSEDSHSGSKIGVPPQSEAVLVTSPVVKAAPPPTTPEPPLVQDTPPPKVIAKVEPATPTEAVEKVVYKPDEDVLSLDEHEAEKTFAGTMEGTHSDLKPSADFVNQAQKAVMPEINLDFEPAFENPQPRLLASTKSKRTPAPTSNHAASLNPQVFNSPIKVAAKKEAPPPEPEIEEVVDESANEDLENPTNHDVDPDVICEMFDFYWRQGLIQEAKTLIEDTRELSSNKAWWKARRAIIDKMGNNFAPTVEEKTRAQPEDPESKKSAAQRWGSSLDKFIEESRPRKALNQIEAKIQPGVDLEWAIVAYERLPLIWERLGMRGFEWRSGQGVVSLYEKLAKRQPAKLSTIVGRTG